MNMKNPFKAVGIFIALLPFSGGCDLGEVPNFEPQFVNIRFHYGFRNDVNTFNMTLTKDLVLDGTITVPFSLSSTDQERVLAELARADFFNLPDTLKPEPDVFISPDPGPQLLSVLADGRTKTVVWSFLLDESNPNNAAILKLSAALTKIVESTEAFKQLPDARGGYL